MPHAYCPLRLWTLYSIHACTDDVKSILLCELSYLILFTRLSFLTISNSHRVNTFFIDKKMQTKPFFYNSGQITFLVSRKVPTNQICNDASSIFPTSTPQNLIPNASFSLRIRRSEHTCCISSINYLSRVNVRSSFSVRHYLPI